MTHELDNNPTGFHFSQLNENKTHYFLFKFKAWQYPFYPLWLPEWSGRYWNVVNQFYCVLWSLQQYLQSPRGGEKAEQGVGSPKIAIRQRELERKKACRATPQHWTLLLCAVESLLVDVFSLTVQSGGMPWHITARAALQRVAWEWPWLAAIGWLFTHCWRMVVYLSWGLAVREYTVMGYTQAQLGTVTDTYTQKDLHICIGSVNQWLHPHMQTRKIKTCTYISAMLRVRLILPASGVVGRMLIRVCVVALHSQLW